jgi:hypothetical protein
VLACKQAHDGCGIIGPVFNAPGLKTGLYCKEHMLHKEMVNVLSKRCAHDGCDKVNPIFNAPGLKTGLYCKEHVLNKEMVNVVSKRCLLASKHTTDAVSSQNSTHRA